MADLRNELLGALGGGDGGLAGLVGGLLGTDDADASERAAGLGLDAILGGLAENSRDGANADAMLGALQRDHDGSVLDDVGANFGSATSTADGEKILGHVFGGQREAVTQNLAAKSGLDVGSIAKLLPALAPMVMGMLGKRSSEGGGLDVGGLGGLLKGETAGLDIGDLLGSLTGGGGGGSSSGGGQGGLGGLLGKLKGLLGR